MLKLHFRCPECSELFHINGYWKWVFKNPFHMFSFRYTKCPKCKQRAWMTWYTITKNSREDK